MNTALQIQSISVSGALMAKHKRRSGKGGRPRKNGPRHPGGKLVQPKLTPNERVVEERRQMLGSDDGLERASHPLDLMLARGWVTERQHRAGMAVGRIHAQAQLGGPRMGNGDLSAFAPAAALTTFDKRAVREWTDEELSEVFDRIFNRMPRAGGEDRTEAAQRQLRTILKELGPVQRQVIFAVCTRAEWPAWLEWRVGRKALKATNDPAKIQAQARTVASWDREREHLVKGLDKIAAALFVKVKTGGRHAPEQRSFGEMNAEGIAQADTLPGGGLVEEVTDYVNAAGDLLYTAVRRRRAS